jgi:hypothetical protein
MALVISCASFRTSVRPFISPSPKCSIQERRELINIIVGH